MRSITRFCFAVLGCVLIGAAVSVPSAFASGNNNPPPTGAILDLGGAETGTAALTVNHGTAVAESVDFTAALTSTDITFAFREDPAFISFGDVTLTNVTTSSSTNLILNGDFSSGTVGTDSATDWTFVNVYGAEASGTEEADCGGGLATCWYDGSVQAYDAIDQFVTLIVGDTYDLSFVYSDNGGLTTFSDLSTNGNTTGTGGNGIDILAYAQADIPPAGGGSVVPEPSSLVLAATGLLSMFGARRRMRKA